MLYQIRNGTVSLGGNVILSHVNFEIKGSEKIAIIGKNGAGKTTLLRLLAGELDLDSDDKRKGPGIFISRKVTVGMLKQQVFLDDSLTVEEEFKKVCPLEQETEYDCLFTKFGFKRQDKKRALSSFSGGEQTKIALIRLLLEKPDILILDEPTNHLDIETVEWLEQYLKQYEKAVVMVSHDRFFLDKTVDVVYELTEGTLVRYPGNYTHFREEKRKNNRLQQKTYERQQEEIKRLEGLVERFKHKPRKAAFARAKKKTLERMERVEQPKEEVTVFAQEITPLVLGSKWVFESEHLEIGYGKPLFEITMRIKRGQKIGILGANGVGKTTLLKTVSGLCAPVKGTYTLGNRVVVGYFDQHSGQIESEKTIVEHFHDLFPSLTEKEVRSILGSYLFKGKDGAKRVKDLSGGEKSRLVLAELLQSRPNFLILDEPTNHMDVQAKEALEAIFQAYTGTMLFVSHDRYFIKQVADAIMIIENQSVLYYPFGYEHYLEKQSHCAQVKAEEQALIIGLRSVPKAERHQLKELPTEEAYLDWKIRLATESMEKARKRVEFLEETKERLFWEKEGIAEKEFLEVQEELEHCFLEWHDACMEWGNLFFNWESENT
jgi:ATP-binding cassette subfamily F protein 3